jgi:hypothetical protein
MIKRWFYREVPEGFTAAKGIVNGIIFGIIVWVAIVLFYAGYLMIGGW